MIDIELNDINFKYPERNEYTLKNINLRIKKNTSIGIIGKTGCGKSTLIKLIMGLLKPNSGNILSNKKDIHKDVRSWFNNISYIPQNIFLADDTIKNNIAFGTENNLIDLDRVKYSIKLAGLEKFIKDLPNGLETRVGDGGFKISGGQVQRIGIARALYKEPNIFILDEATSSLDQKTEDEIINDFFKFNKNKLTIMVSHRLSSLKFCDEVFLIEDGIIKDQGKIDELILRNNEIKK
jgi:ABC-type bacteriocin/lantibiotic exporter with double-glycine peptidase domain